MTVIIAAQPRQEQDDAPAVRAWHPLTRIALRFCFGYFALYCLCTQVISPLLGFVSRPSAGLSAGLLPAPLVDWAAAHVFGVHEPLVHEATASSDRTYDWVLLCCLLVIAAVATLVWSVLDRHRAAYPALLVWFRLFLRFTLAGQLMLYGTAKVLLTQMPSPPLTTLVTPFGELTPMGLLWSSVGAAPAYEIMIGSFEAIGGMLLVLPRTTTLGALLGTIGLTQVFVLNLTYDVPVKSMSLHLLSMSVFLLAPDLGRLLNVLLSHRPVGLSTLPALFETRRLNRMALLGQILLGLWIAIPIAQDCMAAWSEHGGGRPRPPMYGIWQVDRLVSDGREVPPLVTDDRRWRRVFFEYPSEFKVQRMDDSITVYRATVDVANHRLDLSRYDSPNVISTLTLEIPTADSARLSGTLEGHRVEIGLRHLDTGTFPLLSRRFHWVQDYPYNPNSR
ncbi:DoxX family protein [Nocardia sp. NPDC051929]|uniref:DoxX family protein n=1 Tax=Nocardia sp. NPDC051929 TaxID=3364327 RepID=UPI0037CA755D